MIYLFSSWLLLQTFTSLNIGNVNEDIRNYITTSFSLQLERNGLYKWAIYVLLTIKDLSLKKNLIMGVLGRNIELHQSKFNLDDEIVQDFHIPSEWLHEIKATKAKIFEKEWEQFEHLSHAKKWLDGYVVAFKYIIPELMVNNTYSVISDIMKHIDELDENSFWRKLGTITLDIIGLVQKYDIKDEIEKNDVSILRSILSSLFMKMIQFPETSSLWEMANVSQMSKHCLSLMKLMNVKCIEEQLETLVMPPDY